MTKNSFIVFFAAYVFLSLFSVCSQEEVTKTIKDIELKVNENGIVEVTQNIELNSYATIYQADITIPKAKNVEIFENNSKLDDKLEYDSIIPGDEEIINFYFKEPLNAGETRMITLKYSTEFFTNKQGDTWELSLFMRTSNESLLKIIFPKNVMISFTSSASAFLPSAYVENERQIIELEADGDEIDFLCEYKFTGTKETPNTPETNETGKPENESKKDTTENKNNQGISQYFYFIIGILILILILVAIFVAKRKNKKCIAAEPSRSKKLNSSILGLLDENEKNIVNVLQVQDHEITQSNIRKTTGIPGSTLSKAMARLEGRNIIERRVDGKTKWVKLRGWVFD